MRWWHHLMFSGALTLLFDLYWLNIAGGVAFGLGVTWWVLGRLHDHDIRTWLGR